VFFNVEVTERNILNLPYFDNFTNVIVTTGIIKLPKFLIKLSLSDITVNKLVNIPKSVTQLTLWHESDINVLKTIPNTITHLVVWGKITINIQGYIPTTVTHLTLHDIAYRNKLSGWIPNSVTHLIVGSHFIHNLNHYLPKSVTYLEFHLPFNHDIELHDGLTHLILNGGYVGNFKKTIPTSVIHLVLGNSSGYIQPDIPFGVKYLDIGDGWRIGTKTIPLSVTHLICHRKSVEIKHIPSSVTNLTYSDYFFISIQKIPAHVEHLTYRYYGTEKNKEIIELENIPAHIKSLTIGNIRIRR
jgi:hypothetical protein